ncbi:TetR/AcrR family transcriptional regulator [Treponema sp.]|uniref:TetR/AcrR family transcriptional regulator n=1 Tax=Treponema sp. TaxID=166 RepID=UPI003F071626
MNKSTNPSAVFSKKQIQSALFDLMDRTPYEKITVKEILYEAKIARKTFYRNFDSKDDVLDSVICQFLEDYFDSFVSMENESLEVFFDIVFSSVEKNIRFFEILNKNSLLHLVFEKLNTVIPQVHDKLCSDCSYFNGVDSRLSRYLIAFNIGAVWNVIMCWLSDGMKTDKKLIKSVLVKYLSEM